MSDIFKREPKHSEPFTLAKTRKAIDWACACLIRLPIVTLFLALSLVAVGWRYSLFRPKTYITPCVFSG